MRNHVKDVLKYFGKNTSTRSSIQLPRVVGADSKLGA